MNPTQKEEFHEALRQFATRVAWLIPQPDAEGGMDLAKVKAVIAEWEDIWRWRRKVTDPGMAEELDEMQKLTLSAKARVRLSFLSNVGRLLDIHQKWKEKEGLLKAPKLFQDLLNTIPPEDRGKLLAEVREKNQREFDAEREFREAMKEADEWQKYWEDTLDAFKKHWPDQWTPLHDRRVARLNGAEVKKWKQENMVEMVRLYKKHPEIA